MDYLELPRELIYKERRSLEDFAEENEDLELIIDKMISNYYFSSADGKIRVLRCFNTAYYLCTLILLCDKHADWNFAKYCDIAYCNDNKNNVYQAFTLSLVYIFLTHTYYEVPCKKLIEKLNDFLSSRAHFLQIGDPFLNDYFYSDVCNDLQKNLPEDWLFSEEFKPRKIDNVIYHDVDKHNSAWYKLTEYYRRKVVIKIVQSLGKDAGEKKILVDLIRRDAERFYGSDSVVYTDQVKPLLDEIERSICGDISEDDSPAPDNFTDNSQHSVETSKIQDQIHELENVNKQLIKKNQELQDELNAYMERNQNRRGINRLKTAHLGIKLAPKLGIYVTNKKDLAPMLSKLFGWGQNSLEKQMSIYLTEEEELELADIFGELSPELAKEICSKWQAPHTKDPEAPPAE